MAAEKVGSDSGGGNFLWPWQSHWPPLAVALPRVADRKRGRGRQGRPGSGAGRARRM